MTSTLSLRQRISCKARTGGVWLDGDSPSEVLANSIIADAPGDHRAAEVE